MISTQQLLEAVRVFQPLEAAAYLRLHGWTQQDVVPERYSVWTLHEPERGEFEVLLPLARSFSDYQRRVRDVLDTLQSVEKRHLGEVLEDLSTPNADIVRARLAPEGDLNGTLPLEDGASVFQLMRDLMLSAACAAVNPRQVYAKRKPDQAMGYLREARIGQTQRGSYVITVISPVPPALRSGDESVLFEEAADEPFARKTVRTLAEAIGAVDEGVQAAASGGSIDAFVQGVGRGVSANLCEAIIGLNRGGGRSGVEFGFSWAPSRSAPSNVRPRQRIQPDAIPYLEEASRYFRQVGEVAEAEVFGVVHKLEHVSGNAGRVTMIGTVDGERKTVWTELQGALHDLAIRAYKEVLPVRCVGELQKEGKSYHLRNPRDFRVVDEAE
jgi:hypothetical protein